jgi:hypothetical protein
MMTASPNELELQLSDAVRVRSGETAIVMLVVKNLSAITLGLVTGGNLVAQVFDSEGRAVGGFRGARTTGMRTFKLDPSASSSIPFIIGTSSKSEANGHRVPPGQWFAAARLNLDDGRELMTPMFPITIV